MALPQGHRSSSPGLMMMTTMKVMRMMKTTPPLVQAQELLVRLASRLSQAL